MDNPQQPRERDIMYCHSCENEWYRDEHGLECPECHSDFTEIVEQNRDPRVQDEPPPLAAAQQPPPQGFYAPDPDEGDIDNLRWEATGPGRYRVRGTYRTEIPLNPGQQQQPQQGAAGGLMGLIGTALQGMIGSGQPPQGQQEQQQQRPASAPGSPTPDGQRGNGPFIRHGHGPGFSYTIASSSGGTIGNNVLFPRNAHGPQPFQGQPQGIEQMLNQMMMNIGVPDGHMMHGGPGGHPWHDDDMHPGFPPFIMAGGSPGMPGPFANLFSLFGPPGGVAGDAVYTQEALDRIMTQLMEQHQTGNAPGPASEAAIAALPKREITKEDQADSGKAECSICMDEVDLGATVTVLPCNHWFHHDCIKAWLTEHDTCPHCRQGIMPKEGEGPRSSVPRSPGEAPLNNMNSPQFTRPVGAMPGAYPFPRQNSGGGGGTAQNPFVVPDSPSSPRRTNTSDSSSGGGVFSRMRDAFGRGNSSGGGDGGSSG